jgi:putative NADH-flavin reductase
MIVGNLIERNITPKAIIRNKAKEEKLKKFGAEVCICDLFNYNELEKVISDVKSLFVLTPENPFSENPLMDTEKILTNIHKAIKKS